MTARPVVYGMPFSVYVQAVRIVLAEKGVEHDLVEVDPFAPPLPEWYASLHPFGKMPAFAHGALRLYEAEAFARYAEAAFQGPSLLPAEAAEAARVAQALSVLRCYAYTSWVWGLFTGRRRPAAERADALDRSRRCAGALKAIMGDAPWIGGTMAPSLADCFAAPMANCLVGLPEEDAVMPPGGALRSWRERASRRAAFTTHLD